MENYNDFCAEKECEHYIEWDFDFGYGPYPCFSCKKVGQSHNIDEYPPDCPFIEDIKKITITGKSDD